MSNSDNDIIARFSSTPGQSMKKRMNANDRHEFIDWMFEHMNEFDLSMSRWKLAQAIASRYKEERLLMGNPIWVNMLLKCGICKRRDGSYDFEEDVNFTVDEACANPSLARKPIEHKPK